MMNLLNLKQKKKDININGDTLTIHKQNLHINNEKTVSTNKTIIFNDIYSLVKELKRVKITVMENDNFEHEFVITGRHILFDELHFQLLNALETLPLTEIISAAKGLPPFTSEIATVA